MIKRVFKLRNKIEYNKIDVNLLQKKLIDIGAYPVMDKDTLALQIITHIAGRKEYIILIPGKTSFIILNASERSKDVLLKALEKITNEVGLDKKALKEIRAIMDLYLYLDTFDKGLIKAKVKEIIESIFDALENIDEDLLRNLIKVLPDVIVDTALEKLFRELPIPEKTLQYFTLEELREICHHEIITSEAKAYAIRIIKNHFKKKLKNQVSN